MSATERIRGVFAATAMVLVLANCGKASSAARNDNGLPWGGSLSSGLVTAERDSKLVMVDFYTDWCRWCAELDRTTYADKNVQAALARVVLVRLDAEGDGQADADRLGVSGFPTIVFLDGTGVEVGRISGYLPAAQFLEEFEDIVKRT